MLSAVMLFSSRAQTAGEPYRLRDAVECTSRQGLPNFFAKSSARGELRVAYLRGSITAPHLACRGGSRV